MKKISEAIKELLEQQSSPHIDHYHAGLELQIDPVDEETVEQSKFQCQTFRYRIPKNGSTEPLDNDRDMPYPRDLLQQVGTSGWNWRDKRTEFVIFDFDSQHGHKQGLTEDELKQVQDAASGLDYVQVHRSKSGRGLHFYVRLDGNVEAPTRKEHRLASKAVIVQMSKDAGLDFSAKSDCEGVIGWIWNRDAAANGFELVKEATATLTLPDNWQEIAIAAERKARSRRVGKIAASVLTDMIAGNDGVELETQHEELIDWLTTNGWVNMLDNYDGAYLLRTHTFGLKEAHKALGLKGVFETDSPGSDPATPNCFCFPRPNGGWAVRRYGQGCQEAKTWRADGSNWTLCYFNEPADFAVVCEASGATPCGRGTFRFKDHLAATEAISLIGAELAIPERLQGRPVDVKQEVGGLFLSMKKQDGDREEDGPDWRLYRSNWEKLVSVELREAELPSLDHYVRRLVNRANRGIGFVQRSEAGSWIDEEKDNCKLRLLTLGLNESQAKHTLGLAVAKPWILVNDPFGPEYGPGRKWNRDGAQSAFELATEDGPTETWDKVFEHCGQGLDQAVADDPWCQEHGVTTGADYLRLWAASLFQKPKQRLPYLFFYSENQEVGTEVQNSGKSTFHEALGMLMTKGYTKADTALTNQQGFNGELESAILCVVEETDVSKKGSTAYNRIKEWVTAPQFNIHRKGSTPYMSEFNSTHWVQCANRRSNCPVFDQDTRIVVVEVQKLDDPVPPDEFKARLQDEAPFFVRRLRSMPLPPSAGRLYLPVLETAAKRDAMALNRDDRTVRLIKSLLTLGSNLKVWDTPAAEIRKAFQEEFPIEKPPSATAVGVAIHDFREALEDEDFVVRHRKLNGKTQYVIAPRRIVEQVDAGEWTFFYNDDGKIASVLIGDNDPEAVLEDWTPEDDERVMQTLGDDLNQCPDEIVKSVNVDVEN